MTSVGGRHDIDAYSVARQRALRTVLESCGPLTGEGLHELVRPDGWRMPFDIALLRAIHSGRVRRLADDLYAAGPIE